jgi:hypothetical protein
METTSMDSSTQKSDKAKPLKQKTAMKKLDPAAAKLLAQLKEKANKKEFGRKVLEKEILSLAVRLVTDEHLKELQTQTYTERDRLSMAHDEYQRSNGKITLDQFIGKLLKGEISSKK